MLHYGSEIHIAWGAPDHVQRLGDGDHALEIRGRRGDDLRPNKVRSGHLPTRWQYFGTKDEEPSFMGAVLDESVDLPRANVNELARLHFEALKVDDMSSAALNEHKEDVKGGARGYVDRMVERTAPEFGESQHLDPTPGALAVEVVEILHRPILTSSWHSLTLSPTGSNAQLSARFETAES